MLVRYEQVTVLVYLVRLFLFMTGIRIKVQRASSSRRAIAMGSVLIPSLIAMASVQDSSMHPHLSDLVKRYLTDY
jgi:hypothetical protein